VWDIACVQLHRLLKTASFRLTALYSVVFTISFALLLLVTFVIFTAALREQVKVKVTSDLEEITTEWREDGLNAIIADVAERTSSSLASGAFYYLENADGKKLAGNLVTTPRIVGWQEAPLQTRLTETANIDPDEDHQLWGQGVILPDKSFLFAGEDAFRVISAQEVIVDTFLWSGGLALLLATAVGLVVSQGFLRRLDAINRTSLSIMDGTLKARIPVAGTSDEIDRLSVNLNRLFDSNQTLLESLKQVTTNIAHDLRTPLSRLRQSLEAARTGKPNIKRYGQTIDQAISESDQLLATFAALLRIAQIESGSRRSAFRSFDLSETVNRLVSAYQPAAEDQGKSLVATVTSDITIDGDSALVLQALANLLENALRHTNSASRIEVSLSNHASAPELLVTDNGPGIAPEFRTRVFERFFRLEHSRTTTGNGLGLALVAAVAELHHIQIELLDNNPGLKVRLQFPARPL
jgi:signal transduction histidine kinase